MNIFRIYFLKLHLNHRKTLSMDQLAFFKIINQVLNARTKFSQFKPM